MLSFVIKNFDQELNLTKGNYNIIPLEMPSLNTTLKIALKVEDGGIYYKVYPQQKPNFDEIEEQLIKLHQTTMVLLKPSTCVNIIGHTGTGKTNILLNLLNNIPTDEKVVIIDKHIDINTFDVNDIGCGNRLFIRGNIDMNEINVYRPKYIFIDDVLSPEELEIIITEAHIKTSIYFNTFMPYKEILQLKDSKYLLSLLEYKYKDRYIEINCNNLVQNSDD